jgi:hypothetical protein
VGEEAGEVEVLESVPCGHRFVMRRYGCCGVCRGTTSARQQCIQIDSRGGKVSEFASLRVYEKRIASLACEMFFRGEWEVSSEHE